MRRHATSLLIFLLSIGTLAIALKLLDWLPGMFQSGAVRRYPSIAEAQADLGIRKIYVPAYFPKTLTWPPSRILAQRQPFEAVVLEFRRVDSKEVALVITQTSSRRLQREPAIHLERIQQTSSVNLKGRESVVESGFCDNGEPCSQITFAEGDLWLTVQMRSSPAELLELAGSMVNPGTQ
jgi:hypothetical protein